MELKKSRLILILFFIAVLVIYLFIAKIFIPGLVKREISTLNKERGVELNIRSATFDLFRGLVIKEASLGSSISVNGVQVHPAYIRSLLSSSFIIDRINLDGPIIRIDDELPESIIKFQSGSEEKKESNRKIEIKNIRIEDLVIVAGKSEFPVRGLKIELPSGGIENKNFGISGYLENEIFKQKLKFLSTITFQEESSVIIDLSVMDIKAGLVTNFLNIPFDNSFILNATLDHKEGLDTKGSLLLKKMGVEGNAARFDFDLSHNKEKKYLSIEFLKGRIGDLLSIDMNGRAGNLPDNGLILLNGDLNVPEASKLEPWLPFLDSLKISGSLYTNNLLIKKIDNITTLKSGIVSDNFFLDFGEENKLTVAEISTDNDLTFSFMSENDCNSYKLGLKDVNYKGFKYLDYESPEGRIQSLIFNYKEGAWNVGLTSSGLKVLNHTLGVILSDYLLNLAISYTEDIEISGDIKGVNGNYGSFNLLTFFTNFNYVNNKIVFNGLEAGIETYGDIFVDSGSLIFPLQGKGEYLLEIKDSKFIYTDPYINSEKIKGLFTFSAAGDGGTMIEGKIVAEKTYVYGSEIDDLSFDYFSLGNDSRIKNIAGIFSGGTLRGSLGFIAREDGISYIADLNLSGIKNGGLNAESVDFNSEGVYSDGLFSGAIGKLKFKDLYFGAGYTEEDFGGEIDFTAGPETISIVKGFINNKEGTGFDFTGGIRNYSEDRRIFNINAPDIPLGFVMDIFSGYLPDNTFILDVKGSAAVDFNALNFITDGEVWEGRFELKDSTVSAFINNADVLFEDVEGSVTIKKKSQKDNQLHNLLGKNLRIDIEVFKNYLELIKNEANKETEDYIRIGKLRYGFLEMDNIEAKFEMDRERINLLYMKSDVYRGNIYANGLFNFGNDREQYNINLLFAGLSLESISESLPSMKGYITGLIDGLLWFSVGKSYTTINGPFAFWAKNSKNEKRTIGRALLEQIGATGRFFTGSSRKYDKGEISGYISDGFITFKKLIISNKILGYTDLKIKADEKMNSITVKHLLSVIRELARRASRGDIEIDYQ